MEKKDFSAGRRQRDRYNIAFGTGLSTQEWRNSDLYFLPQGKSVFRMRWREDGESLWRIFIVHSRGVFRVDVCDVAEQKPVAVDFCDGELCF